LLTDTHVPAVTILTVAVLSEGNVILISALFCFVIAYLKVALEVVVLVSPQR
jgi:hypothetical protein